MAAPMVKDLALLLVRVGSGSLMAVQHGWPKFQGFSLDHPLAAKLPPAVGRFLR